MPQFQPRRQEQILTDMIARLVTRTNLSDVSDSASQKQMMSAASREDDEIYFQMENVLTLFSIDTATGDDLDERAAEIQPAIITRNKASKATGSVVFSRVGTVGTDNIPVGTVVKTAAGVTFTTMAAGTITAASPEQVPGHGVGRDSAPVAIQAQEVGTAGNVVGGAINGFQTKPAGIDEVTNLSPTTQGRDKETDDAFRQRIKDFIAALARSTIQALEAAVTGAADPTTGRQILFAKAIENLSSDADSVFYKDVSLYIDDGTGSVETVQAVVGENVTAGLSGPPPDSAVGGEIRLFLDNKPVKEAETFTLTSSVSGVLVKNTDFTLNSASGQINFTTPLVVSEVITADYTYYTGLIQLAQKIIDGDANDRINYPGIRAGGVLVRVLTPVVLIQTAAATLTINEGFTQTDVVADAVEAVKTYINNLGISDDVLKASLITAIQSLAGVGNLVLGLPEDDVLILDDELARTTDINITIL